jgi:hypothetical protein
MQAIDGLPPHTYSPARIAPVVVALVKPASVVDWGCNNGVWLQAFRLAGVPEVFGFDKLAWTSDKCVAESEYGCCDFETDVPIRSCDLAVCLECGEHISEHRADPLVDSLTASAPVVLFSGATPGQGGEHHINEQPHGYWHYKFALRGYAYFDLVRWTVVDDERVFPWYRLNTFLYSRLPLPRGRP